MKPIIPAIPSQKGGDDSKKKTLEAWFCVATRIDRLVVGAVVNIASTSI